MLRPAGTWEMMLVLGIPIGMSTASAIAWNLRRAGVTPFTNWNVILSLAIQVVFAAFILAFLSRRHWRPVAVAGTPEPRDFLRGLGLWFGLLVGFYLTLLALNIAVPGFVVRALPRPFTVALAPPVIVAAAIIDPIFEEFFFLGYAIPARGNRFGIRTAFVASVLLRVAAHGYQGRLAIIAILPVALVLTGYFVRT